MAGISPKVLQALIEKMLTAKGSNIIAQGAGGKPSAIMDSLGNQIDEIPPAPQAATELGEARRALQEAQPSDPLVNKPSPGQRYFDMVRDRNAYEDSLDNMGIPIPREQPPVNRLERLSQAEQGIGGQHWDVIIEETGAYGTPVFATKTVRAASREDAIKKVEAEGPFSFQETDPFDGSTITSIANPEGISGNPVGMVHAQPAAPPSRSPIEAGDILPEERSFGRPSETRRNPVRTPDDDIPF
tara:strand:- start:797 stop:1525 length:729 start_codon:yes stop_codon:yes gene_type:complete